MLLSVGFTALLLIPALVVAALWWLSWSYHAQHPAAMPDGESLVLGRVAALACTLLPAVQLLAGILRWHTGEAGLYLWYAVPAAGLLLAVLAVATLLAHARGRERGVAAGMVLLSFSLLVLITLVAGSNSV